MIIDSGKAEMETILSVAANMCAAARTAPKARGIDHLHTLIVEGEDIGNLAAEMEVLGSELGFPFFARDAGNLRQSGAVVLLGAETAQYGLGEGCRLCHFENCEDCKEKDGVCAYVPLDLGIAIGSAVSVAAGARVDNRVMFSAGKTAVKAGMFPEGVKIAMAIPLSVSGKSPYFDRK